jgi:hypothetical protein
MLPEPSASRLAEGPVAFEGCASTIIRGQCLADRPTSPLAITHRTGRRNSPGTGRRFDSIWITSHRTIRHIDHLYDEGTAADSDHAAIIADLAIAQHDSC